MPLFSSRHGYKPKASDILIREDAPESFRLYLLILMYPYMGLKKLRSIICKAAKEAPDTNNWGENDFMKSEIEQVLLDAQWYQVYDAIELFVEALYSDQYPKFEEELNDYFIEKGIGWKLSDWQIEVRGDADFEIALESARETLEKSNIHTSANEKKEAIRDLSRRPNAEITGSIQHSVAALECLCRKVTGEQTMTLGKLIKENPQIVPQPLNDVVTKIFGFASIKGRHLQEGNDPTYEEAELVVHLSAAICTYLCKVELPTNV